MEGACLAVPLRCLQRERAAHADVSGSNSDLMPDNSPRSGGQVVRGIDALALAFLLSAVVVEKKARLKHGRAP